MFEQIPESGEAMRPLIKSASACFRLFVSSVHVVKAPVLASIFSSYVFVVLLILAM
jgi:hypothetical protein